MCNVLLESDLNAPILFIYFFTSERTHMSISRILILLTSFGSTMFLQISLQNHNRFFAVLGAIVLLAGFSFAAKLNKKTVLAVKE